MNQRLRGLLGGGQGRHRIRVGESDNPGPGFDAVFQPGRVMSQPRESACGVLPSAIQALTEST
jgi:hypothetical protein